MHRTRVPAPAPRRLPRQKVAADPEYRQVCLDSPQKWRAHNSDYWRRYREQHPAAVELKRQQHVRDQKQRLRDLAKQQLSFRPKTFPSRDLAPGRRPPGMLQTTTQFRRKSRFWKTSTPQAPGCGILQTTTPWYPGGFRRITEVGSCSRPIRSMTRMASTGPSAGRSVRSNGTCAYGFSRRRLELKVSSARVGVVAEASGLPTHTEPAGSVSPFISSESGPSRAPSSISVS